MSLHIPPSWRRLASARTAMRRSPRKHPRVLHVIPALNAGGAQRQLLNLAIALTNRNFDVSVLTFDPLDGPTGFYLPPLQSRNIPVRTLDRSPDPTRSALNDVPDIAALAAELPIDLKPFTFPIARMLIKDPPDILHAWLDVANITAGLAALLLGIPRIILSTRNVNPTRFDYLNFPWFHPWYQFLAGIDDITFINNSLTGRQDYAEWIDVPTSRFKVIRNGIELPHSPPPPPDVRAFRNELQLAPSDKLISGIFRLSAEKRPSLFLDVAETVMASRPNVRTLIVGDGPLEPQIRTRITNSPHASRMHLLASRSNIPVVYAASDLLLQTSILEGTPNTLLEAQAAGCPVVTTPGGGAAEALSEGATGFLASTKESLIDRVNQLLDSEDLRTQMAQAGPAFIKSHFSVDRMVNETIALYD